MDIKIKICGLTNLEDAQAAVDAGADMLGFIIYPKSPRYIPADRLAHIIDALDSKGRQVLKVGVFVNEKISAMREILGDCGLDAIQLHGEEPASFLGVKHSSTADEALSGIAYKAIKPATFEDAIEQAGRYALPEEHRMNGRLPALLVDTYHPVMKGGTGIQADRDISSMLSSKHSILLAGGLNPANVLEAVQAVQPWGIDVSSGIEASPGKKDHGALKELIMKVKS